MKIVTIIGTRPEIIKMSPLIEELSKKFNHTLIHSGQHYNPELDQDLFKELKLKKPDIRLKTGSGSFEKQMAMQMKGIGEALDQIKPDFVIVQGDTNTALSGALVAARKKIRLIHVESGCRSGYMHAPEEQNRILIDSIADILLCSDSKSLSNLKKEKKETRAKLVGSSTFDAIKRSSKLAPKYLYKKFKLSKNNYVLMTLHRAESMENKEDFKKKIDFINWIANEIEILFCIHPRTEKYIKKNKIILHKNIKTTGALTHLNFVSLMRDSKFILSDSGGIQEEAVCFNRPCLVLRNETEWTRLIKAKKNFMINKYDNSEKRLILKLINDSSFYKQVQNRKSPESSPGSTKKTIKIIRELGI